MYNNSLLSYLKSFLLFVVLEPNGFHLWWMSRALIGVECMKIGQQTDWERYFIMGRHCRGCSTTKTGWCSCGRKGGEFRNKGEIINCNANYFTYLWLEEGEKEKVSFKFIAEEDPPDQVIFQGGALTTPTGEACCAPLKKSNLSYLKVMGPSPLCPRRISLLNIIAPFIASH